MNKELFRIFLYYVQQEQYIFSCQVGSKIQHEQIAFPGRE